MTKNTLLNVAILICKLSRLINIVVFITMTGFFIHFQINPSAYRKIDFNNFLIEKHPAGLEFTHVTKSKFSINNEKAPEDSEIYKMDKLTTDSSLFFYLEVTLYLVLSNLCFKEFQNVLESVKNINTFQERNVASFRKIGKYLSVIFILSSYSWLNFKNGDIKSFSFSITLPCLIILSFIMAEIFKEGSRLSEEVNLTV